MATDREDSEKERKKKWKQREAGSFGTQPK